MPIPLQPWISLLVFTGLPFVLVGGVILWWRIRRQARRFGYASAMDYLRAVPKSDDERRDAADLAVTGLAVCLLGMFWAVVYLRRRSIVAPVISHSGFNLLQLAQFFIAGR